MKSFKQYHNIDESRTEPIALGKNKSIEGHYNPSVYQMRREIHKKGSRGLKTIHWHDKNKNPQTMMWDANQNVNHDEVLHAHKDIIPQEHHVRGEININTDKELSGVFGHNTKKDKPKPPDHPWVNAHFVHKSTKLHNERKKYDNQSHETVSVHKLKD